MPVVAAVAEWDNLMRRLNAAAPEAFTSDQRALNLMEGEWKDPAFGRHYTSSVDPARAVVEAVPLVIACCTLSKYPVPTKR